MNDNYDDGLILIAAGPHDREMIQFNLPYKTYIHEGTQIYWKDSLHTSSKYATWIVMLKDHSRSRPAKQIISTWDFNKFKLVYSDERNLVYKLTTPPIVDVNKLQE